MLQPLGVRCRDIEDRRAWINPELFEELGLLNGHPWAETAKNPATSYYTCLYEIVRQEGATRILEVGTAFGLSAATLLKACRSIELFVSLDLGIYGDQLGSGDNIGFARSRIHGWCNRRGIPLDRVWFFRANTQPPGKGDNDNVGADAPRWYELPEVVRLVQFNEFDVIFVDGKHTEDGLLNDLTTFWPFLKPGGLIICDDLHDPEEHAGKFPWVGDTWKSFHSFIRDRREDIDDWFIWNEPRVSPGGEEGLRPFGLVRKSPTRYPLVKSPGFETFDCEDALRINMARQDHLASLGLDLARRSVLEVGSGVGWHTAFFERLGCRVMSTEGRPENVREHLRRYPFRRGRVEVADLARRGSHAPFGRFDIVYCYGTLYHVSDPASCIRELSRHCRKLFLLETCVHPEDNGRVNPVKEDTSNPNQSLEGIGCRPGRDWVMGELRNRFPHVYLTRVQPDHPDFALEWPAPPKKEGVYRAVFVASRAPLSLSTLSPVLLSRQERLSPLPVPFPGSEGPVRGRPDLSGECDASTEKTLSADDSAKTDPRVEPSRRLEDYFVLSPEGGRIALPEGVKRVWLDVGAHECEVTLPTLQEAEDLVVIAFEPLIEKWRALTTRHPRLVALPFAVSSSEGTATLYRTANNVSSSLHPYDPEGFRSWRDKQGLEVVEHRRVPTVRLEEILRRLPLDRVEFLKIDAQGHDLDVVKSAADQLERIDAVQLEVALSPRPLYENAPTKEEVVSFMTSRGFSLTDLQAQTNGQEANLTFRRAKDRAALSGQLKGFIDQRKTESLHLSPAQAYWNHRSVLGPLKERIKALSAAVGHRSDLSPAQWVQLMAFALEFEPDLILELGRGRGNSTCAFVQAANLLEERGRSCRVVSLCLSDDWEIVTRPRLLNVVPEEWFRPLRALKGDILTFDYRSILADVERCLVFWDAHGFDVAECVLGGILPELVGRRHYVVMHDLSDARYLPPGSASYGNHGLWKGNNWSGPRLRLGHIEAAVEQAIAITDFASRNKIPLHSADHSYHMEIGTDNTKLDEMRRVLGDEFFSLRGDWFWFTLDEAEGPLSFPKFNPGGGRGLREEGDPEPFALLRDALESASLSRPELVDAVRRINRYLREGRVRLALEIVQKELGDLPGSSLLLSRLHSVEHPGIPGQPYEAVSGKTSDRPL